MAPNVRLVASLLLVDLSILVLVLGHFIQLDDASGYGGDRGNLPLGALAAGLGLAALAVAIRDRRARRALGLVLVGGVGVLVVLQLSLDGFRFVWDGDELELVALEVGLACLGMVLIATGSHQPIVQTGPGVTEEAPMSWTVRALLYLALAAALVFVGAVIGASYGDAQCRADGACPEATVGSLLFAFGGFVAVVILIASCEFTLLARRRRLAQ